MDPQIGTAIVMDRESNVLKAILIFKVNILFHTPLKDEYCIKGSKRCVDNIP